MNVKIENLIFSWDEQIPETLVWFINTIVLVKDEKELRAVMKSFAQKEKFNRFFIYGFGRKHLWVKQRLASNPDKEMENRLLIIEF